MRIFVAGFFAFILIFCNGCSVQEKYWGKEAPVFVSEEVKQHIKSTRLLVSVDQDKRLGIPVLGQRTSHQYFGVIGKLAESGSLRFQNDLSEDQRRILREVDLAAFRFNTGAKFRDSAANRLRKIDWLKIQTSEYRHNVQIPDIEDVVKTLDEDALLFIDNRYLMSIDFSSVTVFSYVTLYAHEETLVNMAKKANPYEEPPTVYKNLFSFEFKFPGKFTTADNALMEWSSNEGELIQRAISESIADLTQQIANDFTSLTIEKKP